ncbi:MAG TPA: ABC transporter substrate-binding protein, partial [Candidatus Sulfotelmatobacter sp.]|nr:ABC transporter substrate-binding protein [Candidatus Sulfotelmatobacter sp.]
YEQDKVYMDGVTFKVMPEVASRLAALRTGEVQFLEFLEPQFGPQLEQMKTSGTIDFTKVTSNMYHMFGFNTKRAPFDNEKVRHAIQYAVDRDVLLKTAALGQGAVVGILTPALGNWALPADKYPEYKRDVAKAKALLKEAGYEKGFEFKIMAPSNYPVDLNSAIALVEQLKEVGITAVVDKTEWGTYVDNWVKRNFDTFVGNNGNGTDPDLAMYAALTTGGSTNAFQYSDPEIDDLLAKGRISADPAARKQIYDTVQLKLVEKGPMVYTFATYAYYAYSPKLQGYKGQVVQPFKNIAFAWIKN